MKAQNNFIFIIIGFTVLVIVSFFYNKKVEERFGNEILLENVQSIFSKDFTFRKWVAFHGGVYVPITEETPPNKYLAHIPNRDVVTAQGEKLTLMNPAYALRQFMNKFSTTYGERGKITSLKLINPNNAPDEWEKKALLEFNKSKKPKEIFEKIVSKEGEEVFKYIKPLTVQKSCLKCHAHQGYKVGDIRGGVSITLPTKKYKEAVLRKIERVLSYHIFVWLGGIFIIFLVHLKLIKTQKIQDSLNKEIKDLYNMFNIGEIILFRWKNDENWSIDYVSNNVTNILGYDKTEFMEQNILYSSLIHEDDIEIVTKEVNDAIKDDSLNFIHEPYRVKIKSGKFIWVRDTTHIIKDKNGNITYFVGYIQDITERHEHKQQLAKKDRQLFEQSKMAQMGEMIGNIAHQWRQPLSAISTAASGMKLEKEFGTLSDDDFESLSDGIIRNTQFLSETIDIFQGFIKEKKELKEVVLQERIDNVLTIISASLKNNNIEIKNNIDYSNPIKMTMVVGELSQVLINIMNNAKDIIKEKQIKDAWIKLDLLIDDKKATITIEDNGGGVPEDIISKIFDPYFTTKHQSQGTGLGLHMSRRIVHESLNGMLYVQNTKNGAKFFIELPINT